MPPADSVMAEDVPGPERLPLEDQAPVAAAASGHGSCENEDTEGTRELASLLEISNALSGELRVKTRIHQVLGILERHHGAFRSTVTFLQEGTRELQIEASVGLSAVGQQVRYLLGEGVTGRVVETGKPVVVPQVSREPMFLNRAAQRRYSPAWEITFVCVPIFVNHRPVGSLSVDLRFDKGRNYSRAVKFFGVVASLIAQAV